MGNHLVEGCLEPAVELSQDLFEVELLEDKLLVERLVEVIDSGEHTEEALGSLEQKWGGGSLQGIGQLRPHFLHFFLVLHLGAGGGTSVASSWLG